MSIAPHVPAAEPKSDRPANGRFAPDNKGGPGNPYARQVAEIRKLLLNTVPGEEIAQVLLAVLEKAKTGDVAAVKLLLQYTVGKPAEAVDPDRVEVDEHRLRAESTISFEDWGPRVGDLPARTVNNIWNAIGTEVENDALQPFVLGGLEVEAAAPEVKAKVERRAARRAIRMFQEGISPSANGAIGRKIAKLRRKLAKRAAARAKSTPTG